MVSIFGLHHHLNVIGDLYSTRKDPDLGERRSIVRAGITIIGTDNMTTEPLFAGIQSLQPVGELTG